MLHFICTTWIIISSTFVDYSSGNMTVGRFPTHLENSRYKRNTFEQYNCSAIIKTQGISLISKGTLVIVLDIKQYYNLSPDWTFYDDLHFVFNLLNTSYVRNVTKVITKTLYTFKKDIPDSAFKNISSIYEAVIHFYTTKYAYKEINKCLREHNCYKHSLPGDEQYLAPYSAVLMSVLLYWSELEIETGTTYRGVFLEQPEIDQFVKGLEFIWISFTSSSRNKSGASTKNFPCMFVMDNSEITLWSPKRIAKYAYDQGQDEALYPPGVQFKVTGKDVNAENKTTINLKLISTTFNSYNDNEKKDTASNTCTFHFISMTEIILFIMHFLYYIST